MKVQEQVNYRLDSCRENWKGLQLVQTKMPEKCLMFRCNETFYMISNLKQQIKFRMMNKESTLALVVIAGDGGCGGGRCCVSNGGGCCCSGLLLLSQCSWLQCWWQLQSDSFSTFEHPNLLDQCKMLFEDGRHSG